MLHLYIIWLHVFQFFIFEISTCKVVSICTWCNVCCLALAIYLAAIFVTSVNKLSRSRGAVSCLGPAASTRYSIASGCRIDYVIAKILFFKAYFDLFFFYYFSKSRIIVVFFADVREAESGSVLLLATWLLCRKKFENLLL